MPLSSLFSKPLCKISASNDKTETDNKKTTDNIFNKCVQISNHNKDIVQVSNEQILDVFTNPFLSNLSDNLNLDEKSININYLIKNSKSDYNCFNESLETVKNDVFYQIDNKLDKDNLNKSENSIKGNADIDLIVQYESEYSNKLPNSFEVSSKHFNNSNAERNQSNYIKSKKYDDRNGPRKNNRKFRREETQNLRYRYIDLDASAQHESSNLDGWVQYSNKFKQKHSDINNIDIQNNLQKIYSIELTCANTLSSNDSNKAKRELISYEDLETTNFQLKSNRNINSQDINKTESKNLNKNTVKKNNRKKKKIKLKNIDFINKAKINSIIAKKKVNKIKIQNAILCLNEDNNVSRDSLKMKSIYKLRKILQKKAQSIKKKFSYSKKQLNLSLNNSFNLSTKTANNLLYPEEKHKISTGEIDQMPINNEEFANFNSISKDENILLSTNVHTSHIKLVYENIQALQMDIVKDSNLVKTDKDNFANNSNINEKIRINYLVKDNNLNTDSNDNHTHSYNYNKEDFISLINRSKVYAQSNINKNSKHNQKTNFNKNKQKHETKKLESIDRNRLVKEESSFISNDKTENDCYFDNECSKGKKKKFYSDSLVSDKSIMMKRKSQYIKDNVNNKCKVNYFSNNSKINDYENYFIKSKNSFNDKNNNCNINDNLFEKLQTKIYDNNETYLHSNSNNNFQEIRNNCDLDSNKEIQKRKKKEKAGMKRILNAEDDFIDPLVAMTENNEFKDVNNISSVVVKKKKKRKKKKSKIYKCKRDHKKFVPLPKLPCRFYQNGCCTKGYQCSYSHDIEILKKFEICKYYLMDICTKQSHCVYYHDEWPCKFFHNTKRCNNGINCKFSHLPLTDETKLMLEKTLQEESQQASIKLETSLSNSNLISNQSSLLLEIQNSVSDSSSNDQILGSITNHVQKQISKETNTTASQLIPTFNPNIPPPNFFDPMQITNNTLRPNKEIYINPKISVFKLIPVTIEKLADKNYYSVGNNNEQINEKEQIDYISEEKIVNFEGSINNIKLNTKDDIFKHKNENLNIDINSNKKDPRNLEFNKKLIEKEIRVTPFLYKWHGEDSDNGYNVEETVATFHNYNNRDVHINSYEDKSIINCNNLKTLNNDELLKILNMSNEKNDMVGNLLKSGNYKMTPIGSLYKVSAEFQSILDSSNNSLNTNNYNN